MHIPKSANVLMPSPSTPSDENQRVAERPALDVETSDGAGPSSRARPTRKSAWQKQLVENVRQQQRTAPPVEGSAQRVISPAGDRDRKAALIQLKEAIRSDDDAKIIAACKQIKDIVNTGPRIDETDVECLEKLGPWLRTSENTSQIKSLKTLVRSASADEMKKAILQFANVQPQTQMSMKDRIFSAVERLRKLMRNPDPASPMPEINAAGLQWLDQVLLSRDFKWALDAYKVVVRADDRPEKEIERDVKDFRKLALHWLASEQNKSPIKSLQAMVENTDIAGVKQVIGEFAAGNSPQESTRQLVFSIVSTLRHLTREAASVPPHVSSGTQSSPLMPTQRQGGKRLRPEEAGDSAVRSARRKTNPDPKEDAVASDAASDHELNEVLTAILSSSDISPSLFQD